MRSWKYAVPLLVLSCVLLLPAWVVGAPQRSAPSQMQNLVAKLDLAPEQKAKVDPILAEDAKQVKALSKDSSLTKEQQQAKKKEIRKQTDEKIKPILTAEQWQKLQELRGDRNAKGAKKGGAKKGAGKKAPAAKK